jgi:zinc transport system ATP-binding protein
MTQNAIIDIRDMDFSYDGQLVLEGVNISVYRNELVSIVGPNGGGKTTLLKLMLGLLSPSKGSIRILGLPPLSARSGIGYMPQHGLFDPQFPVSVMDVVLMGRLGNTHSVGPYSTADKRAAQDALEKLQAWNLKDKLFSSLSGGQQQRALIARALASGPELLLLDEPTAGLDLAVETEFYDILRTLVEKLTVVMVSHDLGFVSRLVNKVVCVKRLVRVHPAVEITGALIHELYGSPVKMVRHDLNNSGEACKCSTF